MPVLSRKISKTNTEAETDEKLSRHKSTHVFPPPPPRLGLARWQGEGRAALAAGQKGKTETQREREREREKSSTLFIKIIKKYFHVL